MKRSISFNYLDQGRAGRLGRLLPFIIIAVFFTACAIPEDRAQLFSNVNGSPSPATPRASQASAEPVIASSSTLAVETIPSAQGAAVASATAALPMELPGLDEQVQAGDERSERARSYLASLAAQNQFRGTVLIADNGQILLHEGFGLADEATGRPNSPRTQYRIGSLTKQFTAAAILRLQELGRLSVSDPLGTYLPDFPNADGITIHHLLTHTSGIANYTERPDLAQVVQAPIALDELVNVIAGAPPEFMPGDRYAYSDSGYVLLTKVVEVASGEPYEAFLRRQFLEPLDMTATGYDFLDPDLPEPATGYRLSPAGARQAIDTDSSWPSGAGALYSTTGDLYRWDRALAAGEILESTSLEAMFSPWAASEQGFDYGYGWEIGQFAGRPSQTHAGTIFGFASFMARFPQENATIIVLSNGLQQSPRQITAELARLFFESGSGG